MKQQWIHWLNKGSLSIPHLLLEHYKQLGITDNEMLLLIHLHSFLSQGELFPSLDQLQQRMTCSTEELTQMLNKLHKNNLLGIQSLKNPDGKMGEQFSLESLWEKLVQLLEHKESEHSQHIGHWPEKLEQTPERQELEKEVFYRLEQEFGRALSPMECETVILWIDEDKYEPTLIFHALREAVISNKLSLRYIDRILFEWQKNGIQSVDAAKEHSKRFRNYQWKKPEEKKAAVAFPFYNWLEK